MLEDNLCLLYKLNWKYCIRKDLQCYRTNLSHIHLEATNFLYHSKYKTAEI